MQYGLKIAGNVFFTRFFLHTFICEVTATLSVRLLNMYTHVETYTFCLWKVCVKKQFDFLHFCALKKNKINGKTMRPLISILNLRFQKLKTQIGRHIYNNTAPVQRNFYNARYSVCMHTSLKLWEIRIQFLNYIWHFTVWYC